MAINLEKNSTINLTKSNPGLTNLHIGLGWDEDSSSKRKHYRYYITGELENHKDIFQKPSPFNVYNLKKG